MYGDVTHILTAGWAATAVKATCKSTVKDWIFHPTIEKNRKIVDKSQVKGSDSQSKRSIIYSWSKVMRKFWLVKT